MKSFGYYSPVDIRFGEGITKQIGGYLSADYQTALLIVAKGPFRENGLHAKVKTSLIDAGLKVIESPDIDSNPKISSVREAVNICRENAVDIVVSLGGGSAMDAGKVTAAAAKMAVDPYNLIWGKRIPVTDSLPLVTIPTIASTGTEVNEYAVIVDDSTREKYWCLTKHPMMAILDPVNTVTVPKNLTIWGAMDILSHTFEFYLNDDRESEVQNRLSEAILLATMAATETLANNPLDVHARGELMWCAVLAWGGLTKIGRGDPDMTCHSIEESFSGLFDTHHGACLGVLTPNWMDIAYKDAIEPFARFAKNVMGVVESNSENAAREGIRLYREWLNKIGAPNSFEDFGGNVIFDDDRLRTVAENSLRIYGGSIGRLKTLNSVEQIMALLMFGRDRK